MNMTPSSSSPTDSPSTGSDPSSHRHRQAAGVTPGQTRAPGGRALVLGGGGSAGNAWEIGVIAGLADAGVDVTRADVTIGTSAGATVAAQLTASRPYALLAAIRASAPPKAPAPATPAPAPSAPARHAGRNSAPRPAWNAMELTSRIIAAAHDAADMRRRMGAAALEQGAASEAPGPGGASWHDVVAARLPGAHWPARAVLITAVDARTGEPVVFDRDSGVDLVDAVAASTSLGFGVPPYRIGDGRYIDGGYRRNENADLAAGCARVLVLSPFGGRTRHPMEWRMQLSAQVDELRADGSAVETIFPDEASLAAFGGTMMNPLTRPPAARAGYQQGRDCAEGIADFWR